MSSSVFRQRSLGPVLADRGPAYKTYNCVSPSGPPYYTNGFVVLRNYCNDYLTTSGPYDVTHSLEQSKFFLQPLKANGNGCPYGVKWIFYDYIWPYILAEDQIKHHGIQFTSLDWPRWETMALDKFNPNSPVVDIPLFLFELKDIPRMIKNLVLWIREGIRWRDMPNALLAYNLGWRPLLGDLEILIDYVEKVNKRIEYLKELARKPKTHTMRLEHRRDSVVNSYYAATTGTKATRKLERLVWAQFNYALDDKHIPDKVVLQPETLDEFRDGIKTLLKSSGFDFSWQTLWNALPWSFLVDYLFTIDEYLGAHRNGIPWDMTGLHLMCNLTIKGEATSTAPIAPIVSDGKAWLEEKHRIYIPKPQAHVTFEKPLTSRQWSNVSALSIRPFLRRGRS